MKRHAGCRYCERYQRACGREHTPETRGDWNRAWDGAEPMDGPDCGRSIGWNGHPYRPCGRS